MDTGSGHDIVTENELSRAELSNAFDRGNGMSFTTANGQVDAALQVKMQIPHMKGHTEPYVMPESPALLSVGRRCMLEGYSFIWKSGKSPLLVRPDGLVIDLTVQGLIPYISSDCRVRLPRQGDSATFINHVLVPNEATPAEVPTGSNADVPTPTEEPTGMEEEVDARVPTGSEAEDADDVPTGTELHAFPESTDSEEGERDPLEVTDPDILGIEVEEVVEDIDEEQPPAASPPPPPVEDPPDAEDRDEAGSSHDEFVQPKQRTKAAARTLEHIMSHRIKNPYCEACTRAKMQNKPARVKRWIVDKKPEKFGEIITADHFYATNVADQCIHKSNYCLVVFDRGTEFIYAYGVGKRDAQDSLVALQHFAGPTDDVKLFYSDNSKELIRAAKTLEWRHATCTPGVKESNGVAERAVRKVIEGTRTLLDQSGMPEAFWSYAAKAFCHAVNIEERNGDSPFSMEETFQEGLPRSQDSLWLLH